MRCPYCAFEASRPQLHHHLVERHEDEVATLHTDGQGMFYEIRCPYCDFRWRQRVKPRWKDPSFAHEFRREIALVAFDQLLYHLEGVHG